jgi:triacylglycerol lipase
LNAHFTTGQGALLAEMKTLAIDISWDGLKRPGQATDHFAIDRLPPFSPDTGEFSLTNAFWLSEISRLIYRRNNGEGNVSNSGPSRDEILKGVGLREALFLSRQETQCALIRTLPHQRPPFAVLVFRGTTGLRNWFLDLDVRPEPLAPRTVAHRGFVEALHQVWQALQPQLDNLVEPLFMAGHSMGGALAQLAAWYHPPRAVYSFGAPRVGDAGFAARMAAVPIYRIVNGRDVVADLPPSTRLLSFRAAGCMVHIDRKGRICEVKPNGEPVNCFESGRLSMSALGKRWHHPPGFLVDHAPINYSAKIQKSLQQAVSVCNAIVEDYPLI